MYVPSSFAENDINILHDFIEQNSFATIVTQSHDESLASHIPVLLDRNQGKFGQLIGHYAKANPQSKSATNQKILTIFHGPHTYISPNFYEPGNLVPTWNYQAVHVYGLYSVIDQSDQLKEILNQYVDFYEATQPNPWTMQNIDAEFIDQLLKSIVGFTIDIERIEGKFKLSQNHPVDRRKKVINALQQQRSENAQAIAIQMQAQLPD